MKRGNSGMHKGAELRGGCACSGASASHPTPPGQASVKMVTLSRRGVDRYRQRGGENLRAQLNVMEDGAREELQHLQSLAEDDDFHAGDAPDFPNMMNMDDILTGAEQADLSHAGGELGSLEDDIEEDLVEEDNRQGSKR
ncbi:hypothetical protein B0H14DRAFT_3488346 [Mycena olivaceomarginata]|nr:hypothetical protein B0H14DRAFT_3488346 [Mycena olivaceomarginata]